MQLPLPLNEVALPDGLPSWLAAFVRAAVRENATLEENGAHHAVIARVALLNRLVAAAQVQAQTDEEPLNLTKAALESGYSADHLGRLVKAGVIPNAGRPNAPRILRRDLPRKAGRLRPCDSDRRLVGATPGQIARAVVTSNAGA